MTSLYLLTALSKLPPPPPPKHGTRYQWECGCHFTYTSRGWVQHATCRWHRMRADHSYECGCPRGEVCSWCDPTTFYAEERGREVQPAPAAAGEGEARP